MENLEINPGTEQKIHQMKLFRPLTAIIASFLFNNLKYFSSSTSFFSFFSLYIPASE